MNCGGALMENDGELRIEENEIGAMIGHLSFRAAGLALSLLLLAGRG